MLRGLTVLLVAASVMMISKIANAEDNYIETGRIGVLGAITDDLVKMGPVYYSEHIEASAFFHYETDSDKNAQLDTMFKLSGTALPSETRITSATEPSTRQSLHKKLPARAFQAPTKSVLTLVFNATLLATT